MASRAHANASSSPNVDRLVYLVIQRLRAAKLPGALFSGILEKSSAAATPGIMVALQKREGYDTGSMIIDSVRRNSCFLSV